LPKVLFRHGAIYPEQLESKQSYVRRGFIYERGILNWLQRLGSIDMGDIYPEQQSPNNPTCVGDMFTKTSSQLAARTGFKQALFRPRRHRSGTTESEQPYDGRVYVYLGCFINWRQGMGSNRPCFDLGAIEESIPGGWPESVSHCACPTIQMFPPSLLVVFQGWGLIDLPLRASNEHILIVRVPRAQKINQTPSPPLLREHWRPIRPPSLI
jgi:hypothetical protein